MSAVGKPPAEDQLAYNRLIGEGVAAEKQGDLLGAVAAFRSARRLWQGDAKLTKRVRRLKTAVRQQLAEEEAEEEARAAKAQRGSAVSRAMAELDARENVGPLNAAIPPTPGPKVPRPLALPGRSFPLSC